MDQVQAHSSTEKSCSPSYSSWMLNEFQKARGAHRFHERARSYSNINTNFKGGTLTSLHFHVFSFHHKFLHFLGFEPLTKKIEVLFDSGTTTG